MLLCSLCVRGHNVAELLTDSTTLHLKSSLVKESNKSEFEKLHF
jgi:hypothetical protein